MPLKIQWFGLSTVLRARPRADGVGRGQRPQGLLLGLETINHGSLKDAGKVFSRSVDYKQVIADLHRLGISIQGCFVFGLDHDTPEVFDHTVAFALDAGIDLPRFAVVTPFPGTPLHHRLDAEGRILTRDWELYDGQHVVFEPAGADGARAGPGP